MTPTNHKTPQWVRLDIQLDVPQARIDLPLRAASSLGLTMPLNDFTLNKQKAQAALADRLQGLLAELKPSLYGCVVAALEISYVSNTLNMLVIHPLLPRGSDMGKPHVIDLAKDVEALLLRREGNVHARHED